MLLLYCIQSIKEAKFHFLEYSRTFQSKTNKNHKYQGIKVKKKKSKEFPRSRNTNKNGNSQILRHTCTHASTKRNTQKGHQKKILFF